jgi:hypothetical protein
MIAQEKPRAARNVLMYEATEQGLRPMYSSGNLAGHTRNRWSRARWSARRHPTEVLLITWTQNISASRSPGPRVLNIWYRNTPGGAVLNKSAVGGFTELLKKVNDEWYYEASWLKWETVTEVVWRDRVRTHGGRIGATSSIPLDIAF